MFEKEINQIKKKKHLADDSPLIKDIENILDIVVNKRYTLTDISDEIRNGKVAVQSNPQIVLKYLDNILAANYPKNHRPVTGLYQSAQESYKRHISIIMHEHKDYSKESYGIRLDSSIALKMLFDEGFDINLIELIISKNSIVPNLNSDYIAEIKDGLKETQEQYNKIMSIDLEKKYTDPIDIYRSFIKKHLLSSQKNILSYHDELKIISKFYKMLIKIYEKDIEESSSPKISFNWNNDIETIIKPIIREILTTCSPVATEPGRNKEQYIESLILDLQDVIGKNTQEKESAVISDDYMKKMDELLNTQKEKVYGENYEIVNDCIVAKELLESHQDIKAIENSIKKRSSTINRENNSEISADEYAHWVVECAKESIENEMNIIYSSLKFDEKFKDIHSYEELKHHGIDVKFLYIKALADRISICPSFALRLSERDTDIDVCESLMSQYKDIDILELKSVLIEFSPRARLAGIKENYEERVIAAVNERFRIINEKNDRCRSFMKDYAKRRGFATEGIFYTNPQAGFLDCKTAVVFLKQNRPMEEIKKAIEQNAKDSRVSSLKLYSNEIINIAQKMIKRWDFIDNYTPNKIQNNVVNEYLLTLQTIYKDIHYPLPEMDIMATEKLIKDGKYTYDILYAINDYSPNAIEPGRDFHYKEYVFYSANENLNSKNKIKSKSITNQEKSTNKSVKENQEEIKPKKNQVQNKHNLHENVKVRTRTLS